MRSKLATDVQDVGEFLAKYYRTDRYHGWGEDYAKVLLESHQKDFVDYGYDLISHHDSNNGRCMIFGKCPETWDVEQ